MRHESLLSVQSSLRLADQAKQAGWGTLTALGRQSETLTHSLHRLEDAELSSWRADSQSKELEHLNRSIFSPSFSKSKKQLDLEQAELATKRIAVGQQAKRAIQASRHLSILTTSAALLTNHGLPPASHCQIESGPKDLQDEYDLAQSMDTLLESAMQLKQMATTVQAEVNAQTRFIDKISEKSDSIEQRLHYVTARLRRIEI